MTMAFRTTSVFALGLALVGGCALRHTSEDSDAVNEGADSEGTEANVEALSTSLLTGGTGSGSAALTLDTPTSFAAGCLTVTDDPAASRRTYGLSDCTGPYGLVHVTGTVAVDYATPAANVTTLEYAASSLKVNGATVQWTASATLTSTGDRRDLQWKAQLRGTTANGRAISRTNQKQYHWTVGVACLSASGTSDGNIAGDELKVDVVSYSRCAHECPEAGSQLSVTDVTTGSKFTVVYADTTATYTGPRGGQVTFTPICAR